MTHTIEQISEAVSKLEGQLDEATSAYSSEAVELNGKLNKLRDWLWANSTHTAETVIGDFVKLRDARSALKAEYEERDRALKARMEAHETWLLDTLNTIGADSVKGAAGTAFVRTDVRSSCSDWLLFHEWIKTNSRFDMLEKRVSQKPIRDMIDNGEDLPPGISTFTERVVTVRRS